MQTLAHTLFPLKEHQGCDELHFKKVILLHIEATSATYAPVLCGFQLNRDSPSFEQKLIVHPPLVTHRLSPSIFQLPLPRRRAAFQFSVMEMEEVFVCVSRTSCFLQGFSLTQGF